MLRFSLLMCVYAKEKPEFLAASLNSIKAQTVKPDEIIIVKDGPLTDELESVLSGFKFPNKITIVPLPQCVTLGPARAEGVKNAKFEWIAVMDSDDICLPDRFEKQLKTISNNPGLGLIGGQITEFATDPEQVYATRSVPVEHADILNFAKDRNPFNSMTVMFHRQSALDAGNYRYFPWFEDYDLWVRMIKNGVNCANHPDILVNARAGSGMYERRRGLTYIRSEWRMQKQLKALGIISSARFVRNAALRIPIRLLPGKLLEKIYNKFARE